MQSLAKPFYNRKMCVSVPFSNFPHYRIQKIFINFKKSDKEKLHISLMNGKQVHVKTAILINYAKLALVLMINFLIFSSAMGHPYERTLSKLRLCKSFHEKKPLLITHEIWQRTDKEDIQFSVNILTKQYLCIKFSNFSVPYMSPHIFNFISRNEQK